jgi:hypothetical protein
LIKHAEGCCATAMPFVYAHGVSHFYPFSYQAADCQEEECGGTILGVGVVG